MEVAFRRYRIMSFVTGTTLLTLFVMLLLHTVDLTFWKHIEILVKIDGIAHGIVMYTLYMIATFNMVLKFRLPLVLLLLMLLAGFLAGVAFYLEHRMRLRLYPNGLPAKWAVPGSNDGGAPSRTRVAPTKDLPRRWPRSSTPSLRVRPRSTSTSTRRRIATSWS